MTTGTLTSQAVHDVVSNAPLWQLTLELFRREPIPFLMLVITSITGICKIIVWVMKLISDTRAGKRSERLTQATEKHADLARESFRVQQKDKIEEHLRLMGQIFDTYASMNRNSRWDVVGPSTRGPNLKAKDTYEQARAELKRLIETLPSCYRDRLLPKYRPLDFSRNQRNRDDVRNAFNDEWTAIETELKAELKKLDE